MKIDSLREVLTQASDYQRAESAKGVAYLNGEKEEVVRPRVREKQGAALRFTKQLPARKTSLRR